MFSVSRVRALTRFLSQSHQAGCKFYGSVQDFKGVFGGGSSRKVTKSSDPLAMTETTHSKVPAFAATSGVKLATAKPGSARPQAAKPSAPTTSAPQKATTPATPAATSAPTSARGNVILEIRSGATGSTEILIPAIADLKAQISALAEQLRQTQQLLAKSLNIKLDPATPATAAAAAPAAAKAKSAAPAAAAAPADAGAAAGAKPQGLDLRRKFVDQPASAAQGPAKEWKPTFEPDGCHPEIALQNNNTTAKCAVDGDDPEGNSNMLCYIGNPPEGTTELKFRVDRLGIGMIYLCPSDTPLNPDNLTPLDYSKTYEGTQPGKLEFEGVSLAFLRSGDVNVHTPNGAATYQMGVEAGHIITAVTTVNSTAGTTQITFKVGKKGRIPRSLGPYTVQATNLSLAVGFGWKGTALTLV